MSLNVKIDFLDLYLVAMIYTQISVSHDFQVKE